MELKELIERAEKAAGSQKELGIRIGQSPSNIRSAKAGIIGLPDYACVMIAGLIEESPITVIAASNLVTEKKEERREVWRPFVARAASLTAAVALVTVTTVMTPSPAEASSYTELSSEGLYIMSK